MILDSERFTAPGRFAAHIVGSSCHPHLQPGDLTIWAMDQDPEPDVFVLAKRKGDSSCTVVEHEKGATLAIARLVGVQFEHDGAYISVYEDKGVTKRLLAFRQELAK